MDGLLVFGDINVDILARIENFAGLGGDYLAPELAQHCGGVGADAALALAKWGVPVRLLGCVGRDWLGEFALGFLAGAGMIFTAVTWITARSRPAAVLAAAAEPVPPA